jgi:hypothetical protein
MLPALHGHHCTRVRVTNPKFEIVHPHDRRHNAKSQSHTGHVARLFASIETLQHSMALSLGNAGSIVGNDE